MIKKIIHFFDKLEDKVRGRLSRWPIVYAFVGGIGIVMFWRGAWHTMDFIMDNSLYYSLAMAPDSSVVSQFVWWDGPIFLIIGSIILLLTGSFVSNFIGNEIIISGLKGEKRLSEKTVLEIKTDTEISFEIMSELAKTNESLKKIQSYLEKK